MPEFGDRVVYISSADTSKDVELFYTQRLRGIGDIVNSTWTESTGTVLISESWFSAKRTRVRLTVTNPSELVDEDFLVYNTIEIDTSPQTISTVVRVSILP